MAAHTGQYQCQRCKEVFLTTKLLSKHNEPKQADKFKCDKCDASFTTIHHLRIHAARSHTNISAPNPQVANCEECGFKITSLDQMTKHKTQCRYTGFHEVKAQVCRYFVGVSGCWKGNECRFSHPPHTKPNTDIPMCKNGFRCFFLANGVCSYFHRGIGVQKPKNLFQEETMNQSPNLFQQPGRRWCKYLKDCFSVPNCPFIHANEDFPELSQTTRPP